MTHAKTRELLIKAEAKAFYLSELCDLLDDHELDAVNTMAMVVGAQARELLELLRTLCIAHPEPK